MGLNARWLDYIFCSLKKAATISKTLFMITIIYKFNEDSTYQAIILLLYIVFSVGKLSGCKRGYIAKKL